MKLLFDTRSIQPDYQYEFYKHTLRQYIAPFRFARRVLEKLPFSARLSGLNLGPVELSRGTSPAHSIGQDDECIASNPFACAFLLPIGRFPVEQQLDCRRHTTRVQPGQLLATDTSMPGWLHMNQGMDLLTMHINREHLPRTLTANLRRESLQLSAHSSLTGILMHWLKQFVCGPAALEEEPEQLGETLVGLTTLALRDHGIRGDARLELLSMEEVYFRTFRFLLRCRHEQTDLEAATFANDLGISERHFYRILSNRGTSFRQELRTCRLQAVARELADPASHPFSLFEIACNHGFVNFSHFSRSFRKYFDCTASEYRRQHQESLASG